MKSRKGKRPAKPPRPPYVPPGKRIVHRTLVLLDQGPLRRKAATECGREMAKLDKAKAEWQRFESEDKRAFERWSAAAFGPLLSKMREVEAALREKEALVHEVEMEILFSGSTPRSAYRRVMKRRNAPPPAQPAGADWDDEGPPPRPSAGGAAPGDSPEPDFNDLDEIEQEFIFEEFLIHVLGMNPDRMSDAKYFRMFDEFKQTFNAAAGGAFPPPPGFGPEYGRPQPAAPPAPEGARVKELYRLLVRRLHPDTRAESDAEVSALWHEVQEAYSHGNVERLEMLLALTDIQSNEAGDHTTLFQMQSVLAELRRSLKALQKNLRGARKDPAWKFSQLPAGERSRMEQIMREEYQSRLTLQERELRRLEMMFAGWEDRPKAAAASNGRAKKRAPAGQPDLPW